MIHRFRAGRGSGFPARRPTYPHPPRADVKLHAVEAVWQSFRARLPASAFAIEVDFRTKHEYIHVLRNGINAKRSWNTSFPRCRVTARNSIVYGRLIDRVRGHC